MKDFKKWSPLEWLKVIWRRRWYALITFVLISVAGFIYSWRAPNIYQSTATIRIEPAVVSKDYVRPPTEFSAPEEQMASVRQQLQSRSFMERIIQEFQMFGYGSRKDFSMDRAVLILSKRIKLASPSRNTLSISFEAIDPQFAQSLVKRVVETLIQVNNSSSKSRAIETDQFLDEQLRQTNQALIAQEEKIKQFKVSHLGGLPEQSAANLNVLSRLETQLANAENALQQALNQQRMYDLRMQEQKRLGSVSQGLAMPDLTSPSLDGSTAAATNPVIASKLAIYQELLARYTPKHPDVINAKRAYEQALQQEGRKAQEEGNKSQDSAGLTPLADTGKNNEAGSTESPGMNPDAMREIELAESKIEAESLKSEVAKRTKERDSISNQMRLIQHRLNLSPELEQELMVLSREHESLRQEYYSLQGKKFQSQMTANLAMEASSDIYKIIDEANLPEKPIAPDRLQTILLGIGAGFILGIGAAVGREVIDSTLGSEDEASTTMKIPVLATISEIPRKELRKLIESSHAAGNV